MAKELFMKRESFTTDGMNYSHTINTCPDFGEYRNHMHSKYELHYFISGNVDFIIIGNIYKTLEPGDLVIIPSLTNHQVQINSNADYERIVIEFTHCGVSNEILKSVFQSPRVINTHKSTNIPDVYNRFQFFLKALSEKDRTILFDNLLTELVYTLFLSDLNSGGLAEFNGCNVTIQSIINYIDSNLLTITGINDVCSNLYISRSYLHKIFSQSMKISPMKYIKSKRLIMARDMIRTGEKPSVVCSKVCFNDYTAFYRAYKTYFGYAPSEKIDRQALKWIT